MAKRRTLDIEESGFFNITRNNRNPKQMEFLTSQDPFVLLSGGVGAGKTAAFCWRVIALSCNSPYFGDLSGNVGLIGRLSRASFDKTTLPELKKWMPKDWVRKFYERDGIIELHNESIIHITHLDTMEHLHGYNIGFCGVDQMEQIPEDVFVDIGLERLRLNALTRKDKRGNVIHPSPSLTYRTVFGTANPKRGWLYDRFVRNEEYRISDNQAERELYNPEYKLINVATWENEEHLPERYVSRQKENMTARQYQRRVEGLWNAFEGQIYIDFTDDLITKPVVPAPWWDLYIGIDHGGAAAPASNMSTNVTAVTFVAVEKREHRYPVIHVFDELFLPGSTVEETVREIKRKLMKLATLQRMRWGVESYPYLDNGGELAKVSVWRCDPSMKRKGDEGIESIIERYIRVAVNNGYNMALAPGDNDVSGGLEKVSWLMRAKLLKVSNRCKELINSLKTYEFGKNEKPAPGQNDHGPDSLRYCLSGLSLWYKDLRLEDEEETIVDKVLKQSALTRRNDGYDPVFGNRYVS